MASNFKIFVNRNSHNLHLSLFGDFDGNSAFELLNELKRSGRGVHKVIIHTSGLKNIYPFGRNVFQNNFSGLNCHSLRVLFTGEKASQIAPENSACL